MGGRVVHSNLFLASGHISREGIVRWFARELTDSQEKAFREHLKECPLCSEAVSGYRGFPECCKSWDSLEDQLRKINPNRKRSLRRARYHWVFGVAAAAAVAILLLVIYPKGVGSFRERSLALKEEVLKPEIEYLLPVSEKKETGVRNRSAGRAAASGMAHNNLSAAAHSKVLRKESITGKVIPRQKEAPALQAGEGSAAVFSLAQDSPPLPRDTVYYSKPVLLRHRPVEKLGAKKKARFSPVFVLVDKRPQFEDPGNRTFEQYLESEAGMFADAGGGGEPAVVYVDFLVTAEGTVEDVRVIRGAEPMLTMEAVHLVSVSGKWQPARFRGRKVSSRYFTPVVFRDPGYTSRSSRTGQ